MHEALDGVYYHPSSGELGDGRIRNSRASLATYGVGGQPELHVLF